MDEAIPDHSVLSKARRRRIITAVDATPGIVGDELLLPRLVAEHEGNTHRRGLAVAADTKYGTIDNYQWLEERDVRAAIPFNDGGNDHRLIPRSAFLYDAATDTYRCPTGAILARQGWTTTTAAYPLIIYRPRPAACADCPLKVRCCGTAKVRSVSRPDDGGLRDRTVAYLRTGPARRRRPSRPRPCAAGRGDGKERRGLRRARCRGLDGVRIQALLTATVQNIRKLALSIHILTDIERVCDRVAVLHQGRLIACGQLDDLKSRHAIDRMDDLYLSLVRGAA